MASNPITKEGMKDIFKCSLCSEKYNSSDRIPKALKCGHTFCLACLNDVIMYIQKCPTCNSSVQGPIYIYPTNYAIHIEDKLNDKPKTNYNDKLSSVVNLIQNQQNYVSNFQHILKHEEKLKSISETMRQLKDVGEGDETHKLKNIEEVEEKLKEMDLLYSYHFKPQLRADFTLRNSSTKEDFINKIVLEIYQKNIMYVFNTRWYNKKIYWGKLSYKEGKLCIHSFTTDLPPVSSLFVSFSDLKKCLSCFNFRTFIEIKGDKYICSMVAPSTTSTLDFIKLCSGEDGLSFKQLTANIVHNIPQSYRCVFNIEEPKPKKGCMDDYEFLESCQTKLGNKIVEKMHVMMLDGKCIIDIVRCPTFKEGLVATVQYSGRMNSPLYREENISIDDCGIYISLN